MKTLHSIDLKSSDEPCFAAIGNSRRTGCRVLIRMNKNCGTVDCPFYKPKNCRDWVRVDDNIIPPEEFTDYYRRKR